MRRLQMTEDLYTTKRSLELEWEQEHLKEGKHNIRMIEINKKIQDIIKQINEAASKPPHFVNTVRNSQ